MEKCLFHPSDVISRYELIYSNSQKTLGRIRCFINIYWDSQPIRENIYFCKYYIYKMEWQNRSELFLVYNDGNISSLIISKRPSYPSSKLTFLPVDFNNRHITWMNFYFKSDLYFDVDITIEYSQRSWSEILINSLIEF